MLAKTYFLHPNDILHNSGTHTHIHMYVLCECVNKDKIIKTNIQQIRKRSRLEQEKPDQC